MKSSIQWTTFFFPFLTISYVSLSSSSNSYCSFTYILFIIYFIYYTIYANHDSNLALPEYNHVEVYYLYTLAGEGFEPPTFSLYRNQSIIVFSMMVRA